MRATHLVALGLLLIASSAAHAAPGLPYTFTDVALVDCIDGDTCRFDFTESHPVLGRVTFHDHVVRFADVDTPESYRPRCEREREMGERAKARTKSVLRAAAHIEVQIITIGKYGRLIGHVLADGRDVSALLIAEGLGRPYHGGKREGWCEVRQK